MEIVRTKEEIYDVLDKCIEQMEYGESIFHGMSYEEGVQAMYDWLVGNTDDNPME